MKFYIISIILNIMVLFIPVVYYTSSGREKENERNETMTVNLNVYLMIPQRNRDRKAKVRFFQVEIKKIQEFRR